MARDEKLCRFRSIGEDLEANPQKYAAFGDAQDLFEWGETRIMGD